jgi:HSP20 family molecular chaperone IbpA
MKQTRSLGGILDRSTFEKPFFPRPEAALELVPCLIQPGLDRLASLGVGGEIAPLMNQALGELQRAQQRALAALPGPMRVDVVETDSEYRLVADVPGVALRDVKIDVDANNVLHISAEKSNAVEQDETRVSLSACAGSERTRTPP